MSCQCDGQSLHLVLTDHVFQREMPEVGGNKTSDKSGAGKSLVEARDTFQTLFEMSRLLNTGLDMETLAICVRLCEQVKVVSSPDHQ